MSNIVEVVSLFDKMPDKQSSYKVQIGRAHV